jgi:hypothetical protein
MRWGFLLVVGMMACAERTTPRPDHRSEPEPPPIVTSAEPIDAGDAAHPGITPEDRERFARMNAAGREREVRAACSFTGCDTERQRAVIDAAPASERPALERLVERLKIEAVARLLPDEQGLTYLYARMLPAEREQAMREACSGPAGCDPARRKAIVDAAPAAERPKLQGIADGAEAERERKRQQEAEAARQRSRINAGRVCCCDGTLSPTCTYVKRGCCSHHGGICACP